MIIDTSTYEAPKEPQPESVLSCPFCGAEAYIGASPSVKVEGWVAWCSNADCSMSDHFYSSMPVAEWNKRHG